MPTTTRDRLYAQAWLDGEVDAYVSAYFKVHETLAEMRNTNLLVQVVNTQLRRMERDGLTAVEAARSTLPLMGSHGGRMMVMAATVDIACNLYNPGTEVSRLRTLHELIGA
jgi:hypothetical protein